MDQKRKDVGGKFNINGKVFPIYGGVNPIGRNKEAIVNIKSLGVSQQHALFILVDDDLHFVSDLKSSNGTFLNDKKIDPLQLYRLENGSRVKFADMEGVYSKLTLIDIEQQENFSNFSENTQNFTQNFYGSDTQIMDNATSLDQSDKLGIKYYISTQVLAEAAEELENSYIQAHEQTTQVVLSSTEGMVTMSVEEQNSAFPNSKKSDAPFSNKSNPTFHEDETQVVIDDEEMVEMHSISNDQDENCDGSSCNSIIALHEAETQVIVEKDCSTTLQKIISKTPQKLVHNLVETETRPIDTAQEILIVGALDTCNDLQESNIQSSLLENEIIENKNDQNLEDNANKMPTHSNLDVNILQVITQDNDVVNPLGISNNIVGDTQNSFIGLDLESLDDSDSDIRPVKKSVNIFESQDSTYEDLRQDNEKSGEQISNNSSNNFKDKPECSFTSKMTINDGEADIIRPSKSSINIFESQDSEEIEEDSNDSVDFMTMQKISNTEKYVDSEEVPSINKINQGIQNRNQNTSNNNEAACSETDLYHEELVKDLIHKDDGSETENESLQKNKKEIAKEQKEGTSNIKKVLSTTDSETDIDNKLISDQELNRRKKKSKRVKKKNVISGSESETDIEPGRRNKSTVKVMSICSDSDAEIESEKYCIVKETDGVMDIQNNLNNESVGLILEESALEENPQLSEKKAPNENIPVKRCINDGLSIDESMNESDFIPSTQEDNSRATSQNWKCDNSENSFKLGLTQLMDEDDTSQQNKLNPTPDIAENNEAEIVADNKKPSKSATFQENQKKFVFKKTTSDTTKAADITLDYDEDIYQAKTQNMCEAMSSEPKNSTDDHVFLQPTQEAPKKTKQMKDESIPDEDFYLLSTQRMDGSPRKNDVEDFYQQSTQKLIVEESAEHGNISNLRLSGNEFYHLPTQKLPDKEGSENVVCEVSEHQYNKDDDDDDIFATQVMDVKDSPNKNLESALEHMFATQRALPTEESLDKIQDIVLKKQIIDDKLPTEDKDLEAILATQRMLDSPKKLKINEDEAGHSKRKSLESQLEVMFASQTCNLPPDKFVRPPNPLVNIFGDTQDTQELLKENASPDKDKKSDDHDESESNIIRQKKTSQIGLEQSFALLESKSTRIRRSDRNKNCEEVSVSCPKSRVSMIIAPNDKKILEEEPKPAQVKNVRVSRKRQPPTVIENTKTYPKEPEKGKRRKLSESSNNSDEENQSNISAVSKKQNLTNKILSRIREIEDKEEMKSSVKIIERPETPKMKRSSRIQRVKTEENIESTKDEYAKSYRTRTLKENKASDPCSSNNNITNRDSVRNEVDPEGTFKFSKSAEDNKSENNKKKSRARSSRMTKTSDSNIDADKVEDSESIINKEDNGGKNGKKIKDKEDKKPSKTRTSRVATTTVQHEEPAKIQDSRSSRKVLKVAEGPSDSFDNNEANERGSDTNSVIRRKDISQKQATPSRALKRGNSIQVTTPPKIQRIMEATPSSSRRRINVEDTPNRTKRKLKPKVVFTMMEDPKLESQIKQLGGSVIDSVDGCTALITKFVKRTMKLLSAVGLGKPICSEEWVKQSKKENNFLDPWDFVLVDKEAEKKWNFSLKTSLERSLEAKLFEGYTFQLLVTNAQDVLKGAIESCGGKIVTRIPKLASNIVIVAGQDQKDKYKKLMKQHSNLIVVEPEAIFDGVLRQEIRFENHLLK